MLRDMQAAWCALTSRKVVAEAAIITVLFLATVVAAALGQGLIEGPSA